MDKDIVARILGSVRKRSENEVEHTFEGDALIIRCMDCRYRPDPGSLECFRCMVSRMYGSGGAQRVILRTGMDTEISGKSGQALRRISSLRRWSDPIGVPDRRCRSCPRSRTIVMGGLWESFPEMDFEGTRGHLAEEGTDDRCTRCIASTRRALEQVEAEIDGIRNWMGE
jgi:hypothetical protein